VIKSRIKGGRRKSMSNTGIKAQVLEEIRELARKYDMDRVILFGSRARGDYKRTSDIDLAVEGGDFARFALDVDEETSTLLMYDIVDLSRPVQLQLLEAIRREGKVIYEKI
jgi:predicted nucleotidyltransferase